MAVKKSNLDWISTLFLVISGIGTVVIALSGEFLGYAWLTIWLPILALSGAYKVFSRYRDDNGKLMLGPNVLLVLLTVCVAGWLGLVTLGFISYAVNTSNGTIQPSPPPPAPTVSIQELHYLVNQERAKVGAPALGMDNLLNKSAQAKADDMLRFNYYDHTNPQTGKAGYDYIREFMPNRCQYISENMVKLGDDMSSGAAVQSWVGSPSHYAAIVDTKFNYVGYGIAGKLVVQHFCMI